MTKKIIHYCWFGSNKKSKLIKDCIDSWKRFLPDYKIMEWSESTFDINSNLYVKEAYKSKKWAFVTDYVRLYALYEYGGIYLDTDVEVFKNMDRFLGHDFFSGFEFHREKLSPITAVMGAKKHNTFVSRLLKDYDNAYFIKEDGTLNYQTNTYKITKILIDEYNIDPLLDELQILNNSIYIYPSHYFCNKQDKSYAMHHFNGSWTPRRKKIDRKIRKIYKYPINFILNFAKKLNILSK